ncbi:hypothetical protein GCM10009706_16530 [Curtobacterium citreum]|nr:hypothetical protein GCM10009706_16530 [Curtobacterium citreum]
MLGALRAGRRPVVRSAPAQPEARRAAGVRGAPCFRLCGAQPARHSPAPPHADGVETGTGSRAGGSAARRSINRHDPPSNGDSVTTV